MTVEEFLKQRLPNVSFSDFKKLCASVGIVISSQTDILDKEDISKLVNDYHFNDRLANGTVITSLNQMISRLEKISLKYTSLLSDPDLDLEDRKGIEEARNRIADSITKYGSDLDTAIVRDSQNWRSIYEKNGKNTTIVSNPFEQLRFNSLHTRVMKKSNELVELYKKVDELNGQNAKTSFKKAARARKQAALNKKIEKLRKRQGTLLARQRKVTDRNAKRYFEKISKVSNRETKATEVEIDYYKRQKELRDATMDYQTDIADSKRELAALTGTSAKKRELQELKREIEIMEAKMKKLESKSGKLRGAHAKELKKSEKFNKLS